jgi:hypothetical protein
MRKLFIFAATGALALFGVAFLASPTEAAPSNIAPGVVGPFSWHVSNEKITVGYSPCGHVNSVTGINDPLAVFYGKVTYQHGANVEFWSHDIADGDGGDVQSALLTYAGTGLTPNAVATLNTDIATYTCG